MYSAKIYFTDGTAKTAWNIMEFKSDSKGVMIKFGDEKNPQIIERHIGDIEDINIFKIDTAIF